MVTGIESVHQRSLVSEFSISRELEKGSLYWRAVDSGNGHGGGDGMVTGATQWTKTTTRTTNTDGHIIRDSES